MKAYLNNLKLYVCGVRWLWTRQIGRFVETDSYFMGDNLPVWVPQLRFQHQHPRGIMLREGELVRWKKGYGPWRFLPIYLTTYLAGTLAGYGVISISAMADGTKLGVMIDWFFEKILRQGPHHCKKTGPRLWSSKNLWRSR